ncbi:DUF4132 domain-containing protein [Spirillospora sp. NPDC050679]
MSPDSPAPSPAAGLPPAWRGRLHPRPGGLAFAPDPPDPAAADEARAWAAASRGFVETALGDARTDRELAAAVRRHLAGDADPLGAAGLAAILARTDGMTREKALRRSGDAWLTEHGLEFAVRTLLEWVGVDAEWRAWGPGSGGSRCALRRPEDGDHLGSLWAAREVPRRLRALLADAAEADRRALAERLAPLRDAPLRRVVLSYLLPDRRDWVDECCAAPLDTRLREDLAAWMLWCSVGTAAQADALAAWSDLGYYEIERDVLATAYEGIGDALLPHLVTALDLPYQDPGARKTLLDAMAALPSDEAFGRLADRAGTKHARSALLAAARRGPERALRLLPAARMTDAAAGALTELALAHPELVAERLPDLPGQARAVVRKVLGASARGPEAAAEDLPGVLVSPPWTRRRKAAGPVVVTGLTPPAGAEAAWADGERDRWLAVADRDESGTDWAEEAAEVASGAAGWWWHGARVLMNAPEELARPLLASWTPKSLWSTKGWLPPVAARFGTDALPLLLRVVDMSPAKAGGTLLPFRSPEVARLMADWRVRLKSMRPLAVRWFDRHGLAAARLLVPDALGGPGRERRNAEAVVTALAATFGHDAVIAVAAEYGDQAADAIAALLAADPLDRLPARLPKPGAWADPGLLPQVVLRDRPLALPADAVRHLIAILAMSSPDDPYAGADVVREACDPASLAAFGRALFDRWLASDAPSKDGWALTQLALTGDDETVRVLARQIRAWPGEGGHRQAVNGLDVLAAIGTDLALTHLDGIARKVKFKGLKARAREKVQEVAERLGLTPEQLADRLVPDFGLDADGSLILDYGPRRFTVGFDEQLKPFVLDEDGKLRKALPKPGAKDDAVLAAASYERFAALKKDVRTVAADQLRRMEAAMAERRRWTPGEFRALFVEHPLTWHIARRLVWLACEGERGVPFRIAEDRTFADVADDAFELPAGAVVGIAHPIELGEGVKAWGEVFADYEILQPFPQLGRPVHALTETERAASRLERFEGRTVPAGRVLGLDRFGWERGGGTDSGVRIEMVRPLPGGRRLALALDPGIHLGRGGESPDQTLGAVVLSGTGAFGGLDPVLASEILTELSTLTD